MTYSFDVSELAIKEIKNQLKERNTPEASLRVGLRGGGCSGFSYYLSFEDNNPRDNDLIFSFDDLKIIIDKKSIIYLNGSTLDWETSLLRKGFKFINPNEKSKCGCGTSFDV